MNMDWMHKVKDFVAKIGVGSWIILATVAIMVFLISVALRFNVSAEKKLVVSSETTEVSSSIHRRPFKELLELSTKKATINGASVSVDFKVKAGTNIVVRDLSGKVKDLRLSAKSDSTYRVDFVHAGKYRVYADHNKTRKTFIIKILDNRKQPSSSSLESSSYVELPSVSSIEQSDTTSATDSGYYSNDTSQSAVNQTVTDPSYSGYYDSQYDDNYVESPSQPDYGDDAASNGNSQESSSGSESVSSDTMQESQSSSPVTSSTENVGSDNQ